MDFNFTTALIPQALGIMVTCMAGIFVVLGVIYASSILLQKFFPEK